MPGCAGRSRRKRAAARARSGQGPPPAPHDAASPSCRPRPGEKGEVTALRSPPRRGKRGAGASRQSRARGAARPGHGAPGHDAGPAGRRAGPGQRLQPGRGAPGRLLGPGGQLLRLRRGLLRPRPVLVSARPAPPRPAPPSRSPRRRAQSGAVPAESRVGDAELPPLLRQSRCRAGRGGSRRGRGFAQAPEQ